MPDTKEKLPPATLTAHTVQGPVRCCETHAQQLRALMAMLGAHVHVEPYDGDEPCSNCVNAAKR